MNNFKKIANLFKTKHLVSFASVMEELPKNTVEKLPNDRPVLFEKLEAALRENIEGEKNLEDLSEAELLAMQKEELEYYAVMSEVQRNAQETAQIIEDARKLESKKNRTPKEKKRLSKLTEGGELADSIRAFDSYLFSAEHAGRCNMAIESLERRDMASFFHDLQTGDVLLVYIVPGGDLAGKNLNDKYVGYRHSNRTIAKKNRVLGDSSGVPEHPLFYDFKIHVDRISGLWIKEHIEQLKGDNPELSPEAIQDLLHDDIQKKINEKLAETEEEMNQHLLEIIEVQLKAGDISDVRRNNLKELESKLTDGSLSYRIVAGITEVGKPDIEDSGSDQPVSDFTYKREALARASIAAKLLQERALSSEGLKDPTYCEYFDEQKVAEKLKDIKDLREKIKSYGSTFYDKDNNPYYLYKEIVIDTPNGKKTRYKSNEDIIALIRSETLKPKDKDQEELFKLLKEYQTSINFIDHVVFYTNEEISGRTTLKTGDTLRAKAREQGEVAQKLRYGLQKGGQLEWWGNLPEKQQDLIKTNLRAIVVSHLQFDAEKYPMNSQERIEYVNQKITEISEMLKEKYWTVDNHKKIFDFLSKEHREEINYSQLENDYSKLPYLEKSLIGGVVRDVIKQRFWADEDAELISNVMKKDPKDPEKYTSRAEFYKTCLDNGHQHLVSVDIMRVGAKMLLDYEQLEQDLEDLYITEEAKDLTPKEQQRGVAAVLNSIGDKTTISLREARKVAMDILEEYRLDQEVGAFVGGDEIIFSLPKTPEIAKISFKLKQALDCRLARIDIGKLDAALSRETYLGKEMLTNKLIQALLRLEQATDDQAKPIEKLTLKLKKTYERVYGEVPVEFSKFLRKTGTDEYIIEEGESGFEAVTVRGGSRRSAEKIRKLIEDKIKSLDNQ